MPTTPTNVTNSEYLIKEQEDLELRIIELTDYMDSYDFSNVIPALSRQLIYKQYAAMKRYSRVLHERILLIAMKSNIVVNRTK